MPKFRKKPIVIEAMQFDGKHILNGVWEGLHMHDGVPCETKGAHVHTLEGPLAVSLGDWIITGVKGEIYPCKPDIFAATYDPA